MWFVALGVVAVVLKLAELTAVASWSWWAVLSPFGAAALWWTLADLLGYTRRDVMRRDELKVQRRRQKHLDALGMTSTDPSSRSRGDARHGRNRAGR
jgi:small Trp-rich protein